MKKRSGFVTNSSSSSYICQVCNRAVGGYDMTYEEADMYCCSECGNEFCTGEAVQYEDEFILLAKLTPYIKDIDSEELKSIVIDMVKSVNGDLGKSIVEPIEMADFEARVWKYFDETNYCSSLMDKIRESRTSDILTMSDCQMHPLFCPVCQYNVITDETMLRYAKKMYGNLEQQIRLRFDNYHDLIKFVNAKEE